MVVAADGYGGRMARFEFYDRDDAYVRPEYVDARIIPLWSSACVVKKYSPRPAALLDNACYRAARLANEIKLTFVNATRFHQG